jgi:hypothetical protein
MRKRNKKVLHEGTYDHDLDREYEIELVLKDT